MRPTLYPWSKWLANGARKTVILRRFRDYDCQTHSIIGQIRNRAARLGLTCHITVEQDGKLIVVETVRR